LAFTLEPRILLLLLAGVLYDSIGSKLSMKLMFLVFGVGMFVVALVFAGVAVFFKPYVAFPTTDAEESSTVQCEVSHDDAGTSLLGRDIVDVNIDGDIDSFPSKELAE
jgi:hypothetical protein